MLHALVCRVCGNLALRNAKVSPTSDASRRISNQVGSLILLKESLELLPGLGQPLEGAESELLHAIGSNCGHDIFQSLLESVTQVLDEVRQLLLSHGAAIRPRTHRHASDSPFWHALVQRAPRQGRSCKAEGTIRCEDKVV